MIPAYQLPDLLLGSNNVETNPVVGYVVREAGYYDRPQCFPNNKAVFLTQSPDEATEAYCYAVAHSKYPDCVQVEMCWIHSKQAINGEICNRKFWTPT